MESGRLARFGLFELAFPSLELRRSGRPVRLGPQPARALAALVRHAGEIVTRETLAKEVWTDGTFVDFEQGLNFCIRQIRAALADHAENPQFIETIPRRGYRFLPPVSWTPVQAEGVPGIQVEAPAEIQARVQARVQPPRRVVPIIAAAFVIVVALGAWASWLSTRARPPILTPTTVAVLPFDDLSGGQAYFADGVSEELATQLARIDAALTVIGRTSMRPFRDSPKTAREIGMEVGAAHLVDGTVRRSGNRVRVTAELIRVSDQTRMWSDAYEADATEILSVQQQIGVAIARQVLARVSPPGGGPGLIDSAVYDLYLQGRFYWTRRDASRAQDKFKEAVRLDPAFARGYAGLGDCSMTAALFDQALDLANKALALDARLAEALVTRAHALLHLFRWSESASAFEEALSIDPSLPEARYFYAEFLVAQGRAAEAVREARAALTLDPLSAITMHAAGVVMYYAGDYETSRSLLLRARELDPSHRWTEVRLALLAERREAFDEAIAAFRRSGPTVRGAYAYGRGGHPDEARHLIDTTIAAGGTSDSYHLASAYLGLGDEQSAMKWLQAALHQHHYDAIYTAVDPRLAPLHQRRDFRALLAESGWPASVSVAGIGRR